jgi:hypothetical protein
MSAITPTTPAVFYDFNDKTVSTPLIALTVLVSGLKFRVERGEDAFGVEPTCRKLLSAPDDYPIEQIYSHLLMVLRQTKEHYGLPLGTSVPPEKPKELETPCWQCGEYEADYLFNGHDVCEVCQEGMIECAAQASGPDPHGDRDKSPEELAGEVMQDKIDMYRKEY